MSCLSEVVLGPKLSVRGESLGPKSNWRLFGLDELRGLAVLLMVLDHSCAVLQLLGGGSWLWWVRVTAGRFAAPLFCLVIGHLWAVRGAWRWSRRLELLGLGVLCSAWSCWILPLGRPDVLLMLGMIPGLVARVPIAAAVLGIVQGVFWPVPWSNLQLGFLVAYVALGAVWTGPAWVWRCRWLEVIGRHPIGAYIGHLLILGIFVLWYCNGWGRVL